MATMLIVDSQNVEQKRLNIEIQGFVVNKKFGNQTQISAINTRRVSIYFKNGQVVIAVDFVARRILQFALFLKAIQLSTNISHYLVASVVA
jgi:hypothetical protein